LTKILNFLEKNENLSEYRALNGHFDGVNFIERR